MKSVSQYISLRRGVTILGFLSLIICIVEWVISTTFNFHENSFNQPLKTRTAHISSLLTQLAEDELHMSSVQIESLKNNCKLIFDGLTGELFVNLQGTLWNVWFTVSVTSYVDFRIPGLDFCEKILKRFQKMIAIPNEHLQNWGPNEHL